jgi:hypothetical protein
MGSDFAIAAAICAAGIFGLLFVRRRRMARQHSDVPERPPGKPGVLRILFLLFVIAGPLFLVARGWAESAQRRKVRQTMSDMRLIAGAWEARALALNRYNAAGEGITFIERNAKVPTVLRYTLDGAELSRLLVPKYLNSFPARDAWGNEWLLAVDQPIGANSDAAVQYAIASPGRDGRFDRLTNGNVPCGAWECDIVFFNGQFVTQFPSYER